MIPLGGGCDSEYKQVTDMRHYGDREQLRRARELRSNMTKAEIILWSRIRSKQILDYKFRRQQPIFNYIVDFYCSDLKLIIEVDGPIHSLDATSSYDKKRENILKLNGYYILRFSNVEIETDLDSSINRICSFIHENFSVSKGVNKRE